MSQLVQHPTTTDGLSRWELLITDKDLVEMHPEQIETIKDGLWLISQALSGRVVEHSNAALSPVEGSDQVESVLQ